MNKLYTVTGCFLFLFVVCMNTNAIAQTDTVKMPLPPMTVAHNAGFDVIIKRNGDILYGLVKEVGQTLIAYQRTDIPDGPIYTIPRNEVYAISYRNQVVDYIEPGVAVPPLIYHNGGYPHIDYKKNILLNNSSAHIGIGFIRSFSKIQDANNYSSSGGAPVVSLGYDVSLSTRRRNNLNPYDTVNYKTDNKTKNIKIGLMIGFGSHKLSRDDISLYDSTTNNVSLKESIFGLYAYGKYSLLNSTSRIQPYITLGLGIATSHITTVNRISFINDASKELLVKSGARGVSLNLMARVGAEYYFSNQLQAFIDAGSGLSILNLGISLSVK